MSNADSLYKAHSNNSFDSQSQYTGRYLKLFQQQTKNSKIGTSIFSYEQKKQQLPKNQILYTKYAPSYSEDEELHYLQYANKSQKENEIFGDLERMRNEHFKIMGLMEEQTAESSRKMESIEKELTQKKSVQHYMPDYNPPTFNNLNSREQKTQANTQQYQKRNSIENYVMSEDQILKGPSNVEKQDLNNQIFRQDEAKLSRQNRFTFAPSSNQYAPDFVKTSQNNIHQYQLDSPHRNLKDTIQFQTVLANPSSSQLLHYQKQQKINQGGFHEFSQQSLSYSQMKKEDVVIEDNQKVFQQQGSRGIVLGDAKVVQSKLQSGGRLPEDSKNKIQSNVIERQTFDSKIGNQNKTRAQEKSSSGLPQTSIKMINMQQASKNNINQANNLIRAPINNSSNEYQLQNQVIAKVSSRQSPYKQIDQLELHSQQINPRTIAPVLDPKALIQTVDKQLNYPPQQRVTPPTYAYNYTNSFQQIKNGNSRPTSSYNATKFQQQIQPPQLRHHIHTQPLQNPPVTTTAQTSFNPQFQRPELFLWQPLSPRAQVPMSNLPFSPSIRKSIGLAHHNRLGSPARKLQPELTPRIVNREYFPRTISDYYYNIAKQFPIPGTHNQNAQMKIKFLAPNSSTNKLMGTLRPTSSGPRALSPRPMNQPSTYIPTALRPESKIINNINQPKGMNHFLPNLNLQPSHYPYVNRPFSPYATSSPRGLPPRPTSVPPQTHRTLGEMQNQMKNNTPPLYQDKPNLPNMQRATSPSRRKSREGITVISKR